MAIDSIKKAFAVSSLRRSSYRWPPRYQAMNAARVERGKYKCAKCDVVTNRKNVQVDHLVTVVPLEGFDSWDGFIDRLFCDIEGFRVLCKPCHSAVTKIQNAIRRDIKKQVKEKAKTKAKEDAKTP